jgi:4-carboxymuconolactone decarboxylase
MSRLPELQPDSMTDEQRAVFEEILAGPHGHVVGPYPAWLRSPELARRIRAVSEYIRFQSSLPRRLSELGILVTGRHWKAEFEYYAHAALARKAGLEEDVIAAIARRERPSFRQANDGIVYDLCTELFEQHRIGEETYRRAVDALGLQWVVELVATIGYYTMVSLTLNTFEVPLPPGEPSPFPDE